MAFVIYRHTLASISLMYLSTVCTSGLAQQSGQAAIKLGDSELTPIVRIDYVTNSNAYLSPSDEVEATGFIVAPEFVLSADRGGVDARVGYQGEYAGFSESALDYDDHRLFADVSAEISSRKRLLAAIDISIEHEELGVERTEGSASADSEQVESLLTTINTQYSYGALSAKGNAAVGVFARSRGFRSREDITEGEDFTELTPFGRFSYRLSSDTRALLEARYRIFNFDNSLLDRNELQILTGLVFSGSSRVGGEAKFGLTSANYQSDAVKDTSLLAVDVNVYYLAASYSRISLRAVREFNNADGRSFSGGAQTQTIDDLLELSWDHKWSTFVGTRASVSAFNRNRECPSIGTQTFSSTFELGLSPRRWLEFGVGLQATDRSADNCEGLVQESSAREFDRQKIGIYVRATL